MTDISTFGWLISNVDTATTLLLWAAVVVVVGLTVGLLANLKGAHAMEGESCSMETLVTIVAFAVVLVIVGVALDAARRK